MTASGTLRDRLTLRALTTSADALGGQTSSWGTVATVAAELLALSGDEAIQAGALQSTVQARARVHWRAGITVTHRAYREPSGPLYEITAVRDVDGRRIWLELDLREVA